MSPTRRSYPIVVLRCLTCGLEVVGALREGRVYATNFGRPADAMLVDGHCAAHGGLLARQPDPREPVS